ncbi:MAG TPA: MFS transporter, partial [Gemmatimonadaceae bacterium]
MLGLSGTGAFMTTLDTSIVNIGLPTIAREFNVPLSGTIEWVVIGYLVVIAATLLTFGRLADEVGRKPLFIGGLAIFTIGSALCGAAPSLGVLIAARAIEAIGAAAIFSVNIAMITGSFPESEHGRALGFNAILVALAVSVGPTVGGILSQTLSWRWIFYVNIPIGLLVIPAAWRLLTERAKWSRQRFDVRGAVLLAIGLVAINLALSFGQEWGWGSARFLVTAFVGVGTLVLAARVEKTLAAPLLDPALFRNRVFVFSNISFMLAMMALFAISFLLPFYFEELRGYDTKRSGLLLTPLALTLAVVAPISGTLSDRLGSRWLSPVGLAIACLGLWLLSRTVADTTITYIVVCLVVAGIGQGLFVAPNSRSIMDAATRDEQGVASGVLATARGIGQSLSVAV